MKIRLSEVRSDDVGFTRLTAIVDRVRHARFDIIDIDMSRVSWFDANMCAPFGAILYKASRAPNTVTLSHVQPKVEAILSKNKFLQNYGRKARIDTYGTTIEYIRLDPEDDRYFGSYIESNLIGKGLPRMSRGLKKKFMETIFEIFSNAAVHSRTRLGIFSCGQFFPTKERLDFSIADLGVGICKNVNQKTGQNLTPQQAILWAVQARNTTKSGPIPGGLGLKLLTEFVSMNGGRIQIVSDSGYWELTGGRPTTKTLPAPFPGTVVNIEINTADTKSYRLASELRPEDVF